MRPAGHNYCVARAKPRPKLLSKLLLCNIPPQQHSRNLPKSNLATSPGVLSWNKEVFISRWTRNEKEDEKSIKDGRDIEEKFEDCVKLATGGRNFSYPRMDLEGDFDSCSPWMQCPSCHSKTKGSPYPYRALGIDGWRGIQFILGPESLTEADY